MSTKHHMSLEDLAEAFREFSISERLELISLLPENWFEKSTTELNSDQREALGFATEKENEGRAVFHTWEEVEAYVKNRPDI